MTDTDTDAATDARPPGGVESVTDASQVARRVVTNVEEVIVGNHEAVEHLVVAVLGRGHVLLEDVPGTGKTMLARAVARSFECEFARVQFTPDLLPADITGANVFDRKTREFEFRPGPIFANVVLGDEINRAPPKTQAALLEAMEEAQVTVDGETHGVPDPFVVIATQNTVERDRTYALPAAELDRFLMKLSLGYPKESEETALLGEMVGDHPIEDLEPVATVDALRSARGLTSRLTVEDPVREYVTRLARYTREHADLGVSPRGSIALIRAAQGRATLAGREYVIPDDVQQEARVVLPHRILTDTAGPSPAELVEDALASVRVE